ncbi:MAG TPA: hypothetical protein VM940_14350 [Chthoniobacterales bacterium]|nr:hypothetical protein [Chthoniobacterales bacterium]
MKTQNPLDIDPRKPSLRGSFRYLRRFTIFCALAILFAGPSVAHAILFTGNSYYYRDTDGVCRSGAPGNSLWSDPKNWGPPCEPAGPPGAGDSAEIIDRGVVLNIPVTVANLTVGGGGNGGEITNIGGNSLTVTNRFELSRGHVGGEPLTIVIPSSGTLVFSGPSASIKVIGNCTINNAGRIEWSGGSVAFESILNNSGIFVISGDGGFGHTQRVGVINNTGHIIKEGSSGVTQFGGFTPETNQINTTINNQNGGVLEVATGTIEIGGGTGKGEFRIATGRTLLLGHGGVYTFEEPATFTGGGTCLIRHGSPRFAGNIYIASTIEVAQDSAGFQTGNGASLTEATFHGTGRFVWKGPGINGKLTLAADFRTIVDGVPKTLTTLINKGTMSWLGGSIGERGGQYFYNEGSLNVLAAGEFLGFASYFYNSGTVTTFGGGTSTSYAGVFENTGLVNIGGFGKAGILQILGSFTQTATGTLDMEVGGVNGATPQFDQLLGNSKIIDGTLTVEVIDNFVPAKGARFTLIDSQSGKFARVFTPGGAGRFLVEYPGDSKTDLVSLSDAPIPLRLWGAGRDLARNESPDRDAERQAVNQTTPQWSYGYRSTAAGTDLTLFTPDQHINDGSGLQGWIAPGQITLAVNTKSTPIVFNTGSGNYKPLFGNQIYISPGPNLEFVVARWTAPATGDYRIVARWLDLDNHGGNGATAYLFKNGQEEFVQAFESTAAATGRARLRAITRSLNAGDVLDFVVGANGGHLFDATAFNAAVRRVPKVTTAAAPEITLTEGQDLTIDAAVDVPVTSVALDVDGETVERKHTDFGQFTLRLEVGTHFIRLIGTDDRQAPGITTLVKVLVEKGGSAKAVASRGGKAPASPRAFTGTTYYCVEKFGYWQNPNTWSPRGVPGNEDMAVINPDSEVLINESAVIHTLHLGGRISQVPGVVAQPGLYVNKSATITGGRIEGIPGQKPLIFRSSGKLYISVEPAVFKDVELQIYGKFNLTGGGVVSERSSFINTGDVIVTPEPGTQKPVTVNFDTIDHNGGKLSPGPNVTLTGLKGIKINAPIELTPNHAPKIVTDNGAGLVSENGLGLISDNGAVLIGLDGGTLIGLDGGTLIGNDGGTLIDPEGFALIGNDGGTLIGLDGGTIQPSSAESITAPTAGGILLTGGTITGTGELRGNVVNQGAFIAPGNSASGIVVNGDYTQGAAGTLVLEIGGKTFNPFTYDMFQVSGTANLGGALVVKTLNGYTPTSGDKVNPLLYGSHTGSFDSVSSNAQVTFGAKGAQVTTNGTNPLPPKALNIATRMKVETGDNALIAGFIITGNASKKVIIRGIGPSLPFAGVLSNPTLSLDNGAITNDNWRSTQEQEIIDTTIPPSNNLESAIVATLSPGAHTAVLRGSGNSTGIGVIEVYDLESGSPVQLANISSRGLVQAGDNVMIGGFIIGGTYPAKVIVRAIGSSLPFAGKLENPTLEVVDQNGGRISNDNWRETQETEVIATTIPPTNDNESAIVATLAPGAYTAVVRGADNTTGIAVVEAYNLQ